MGASDLVGTGGSDRQTGGSQEWPLTARDVELDLLTETLSGDLDSSGVLIVGPAGAGKTRLAREAARIAADNGWVIRSVQGTKAAQDIPLGAFARWIDRRSTEPLNLVSSVIETLSTTPDRSPVLIAADDIHLFDDLSAFVLHQLVIGGEAAAVCTLRSGEPVAPTLQELWKGSHLQRLEMRPLSRGESATLLATGLGGRVNPQTVERLWELSQGNVLYLTKLVCQECRLGRLTLDDAGVWSWTGSFTVTPSLAQLVEVYTGIAPAPAIEVLDLVSVAEPLELTYLTELADPVAIEAAEQHGLIAVDHTPQGDLVSVTHPLYGETRRSRMGRFRGRRLRGQLARVLNTQIPESGPADPVRLALLWLDSDLPADAGVFSRGAATAIRRLDAVLSSRLSEAAIRAGAGVATQLLHARTLTLLGRASAAGDVLDALPALDAADAVGVAATVLQASNLLLGRGLAEDSYHLIEAALELTPVEIAQELVAFRSLQLAMAARPVEVLELLRAFEGRELTPRTRTTLNFGATIAFGELGDSARATLTVDDLLLLSADSPVAIFESVALALMHVDALATNGLVAGAVNVARDVTRRWVDVPRPLRTIATAVDGVAAVAHGDLTIAVETLTPAVSASVGEMNAPAGEWSLMGVGYWLHLNLVEALGRAGLAEEAAASLELLQRTRHPAYVFQEPNRFLATAWAAAADNRIYEAVELAGQAARFAQQHGQCAREVLALQSAIQLGDTADHTARLEELKSIVKGPRAGIVARWAKALSTRDGRSLMAVSRDLEAIGDRVGAADAAAHAVRVFDSDGERSAKSAAAIRASQLSSACGSLTPAIRHLERHIPLSRREHEIAVLVADGKSNKEIADDLVLSVRTVEGHIYRACARLGCSERAELGEFARR